MFCCSAALTPLDRMTIYKLNIEHQMEKIQCENIDVYHVAFMMHVMITCTISNPMKPIKRKSKQIKTDEIELKQINDELTRSPLSQYYAAIFGNVSVCVVIADCWQIINRQFFVLIYLVKPQMRNDLFSLEKWTHIWPKLHMIQCSWISPLNKNGE